MINVSVFLILAFSGYFEFLHFVFRFDQCGEFAFTGNNAYLFFKFILFAENIVYLCDGQVCGVFLNLVLEKRPKQILNFTDKDAGSIRWECMPSS